MSSDGVDQPATNITIEATSDKGVGEIADVLSVTERTNWAGDIGEDSAESFLSGQEVVNHFPQKSVVT